MGSLEVFFIFLSSTLIPIVSTQIQSKCCGLGDQIIRKDSELFCAKAVQSRYQENFETKDFLKKNISGTCVDVYNGEDVATFIVKNETKIIEKLDVIDRNFLRKCCPMNYVYNTSNHGCKKKTQEFLQNDTFVRIGLMECGIISDKIVESMAEVEMNGSALILKKENRILTGDYCVDSTLDGKIVVRICENDTQICSKVRCIRKCCRDGQSFINRTSSCRDTFKNGIDLQKTLGVFSPDDPFVLVHGFTKPIKPISPKEYEFAVDRFGVFSVYMNKTDSFQNYEVTEAMYCIEHAFREKNNEVIVNDFLIFAKGVKEPPIQTNILITRWLKIISCISLILTIAVYLLIPKMRNLFGKILLSYCSSTLILFTSLTLSQFFTNDFGDGLCRTMGFISILSTLWSFTWLQIMCLDIWFSFGTPRSISGPLQKNECKRLLQYSLYGWGFPMLWVAMITIFSVTTIMPEAMYPVIGHRRCFLENSESRPGNYSVLIYVTIPLLIQQMINTILFIKTILYCLRIKAEIERMNDSDRKTDLNASRERLKLIMKLAVIMGVFFIFETLSSLHNFQKNQFTALLENVWDSINCLQGFFIFIIFICKRNIFSNIYEAIPCVLHGDKLSTETQVSMYSVSGTQK